MVSPSLPALAAAFPDSAGMVTFSRNRIAPPPDVWVREEESYLSPQVRGKRTTTPTAGGALSLLGEQGRDVHKDPVVLDEVAAHVERTRARLRPRPNVLRL